jgi:hypothetical protein
MRRKGGMMKRFLVLLAVVGIFIACDYASEAVEMKPDIEVVWIDPLGATTSEFDSTSAANIDEVKFVAENSIDCYLTKLVYEYYYDDSLFYGPDEIALYAKINGIVDGELVDTLTIENIPVPLAPVRDNLEMGQSARVMLRFIAVDEYSETEYDTSDCWFGVYMMPFE